MKQMELVKRLQCNYGILVIHYNLEFSKRMIEFSKRIAKIGKAACKYAKKAEKRGEAIDYSKYWRALGKEFDCVFGEGSCRIVFGGDMVSAEALEEFVNKAKPYFDQWAKEVEDMAC